MFLTLLMMLVLVTAVLVVFLWAGTVFFQGYIYTEAAKDLHWRAPAAAGVLGVFLVAWCALDASNPGHLDTLFSFNTRHDEPFTTFKSRKKGSNELVLFTKRGQDFRNSANLRWKPVMDGSIVEAVSIKLDGREVEFHPRVNAKGKFEREPGDSAVRYVEVGGGRALTSKDLEENGVVTSYETGAFVANVALNLIHLALWFVCLWLLLNYQWSHALGLAVAIWLAFSIPGSVVNMLLTISRSAARESASQKEAGSRGGVPRGHA